MSPAVPARCPDTRPSPSPPPLRRPADRDRGNRRAGHAHGRGHAGAWCGCSCLASDRGCRELPGQPVQAGSGWRPPRRRRGRAGGRLPAAFLPGLRRQHARQHPARGLPGAAWPRRARHRPLSRYPVGGSHREDRTMHIRAVLLAGAIASATALAPATAQASPRPRLGRPRSARSQCAGGQLLAWVGLSGRPGTARGVTVPLEFSNVSRRACWLSGYPGVLAVGPFRPSGGTRGRAGRPARVRAASRCGRGRPRTRG